MDVLTFFMTHYFSPKTRLAFAWFCFIVHVFALLAVLLVIRNGIPPGDLAARAAYVAANAGAWRIAWALWLPASLALVLFFAAWADVLPASRRAWGALAVALTLAGAAIDWVDETFWIALAPGLAARFASDAFAAGAYALWDRAYVVISMGLANALYTIGGIILTALAFKTRGFPKWLAWWSTIVWALSLDLSIAALIGDGVLIQVVSTLVFAAFMPWLVLMGYGWLMQNARGDIPAARVTFNAVVRSIVPKHPIPMQTVFRECFLVNFAIKPEALRPLIPEPIELDLHDGEAYLSIVVAEMDKMRPAFLPRVLGITYNQVVYRVVVRANGERGVCFLRSDADNALMSIAGDWLTFFRFHVSPIKTMRAGDRLSIDLTAAHNQHADIHATYDLASARRTLPASSRFASFDEAKEFLVQLFAAFAYDPLTDELSRVRIHRGEWNIDVVDDARAVYEWMQRGPHFNAQNARLDSIFYVREIPYEWHTLEKVMATGGEV
ncbi:MAG TPA: DUF2071 domain-containing protein [Anaerolineae bacterium]